MFGGEWAMNDKSTDYNQRKNFNKDKYNFILNDELMIDPFSKTNGIIPNLIMSLFQTYGGYDSKGNTNIIITCSYIQIYNEKVYDLLIDEDEIIEQKKQFDLTTNIGKYNNDKPIKQKPLKIKYDKNNGVILEGVNEIRTPSFYDIFELLRQGEINRKIRQTKRNEMSSRSHTIFIINVQNLKTNVISKIKLCDLAGSERYDSRESYKKLHFDEMVNINKSLLILGNVIHALGTNNNSSMTDTKNKKQKKIFAPYKDSKLTQILEDSLGGNSVTYLLATISPCDENFDETISTLKFADRAHSIMTKVSMNKLGNNDDGSKSKEFNKICDELFQLKQLLNIRRKRGTLEPIQEELLKLKDENVQLKKYLGGSSNIDRIKELMDENNNLRKEIKNLSQMNRNLKNEMKNIPISQYSAEENNGSYKKNKNNNYNPINKNKKQKKVFAPYKDSKLTQILEDSLGGNSITYLIANISPNEENFDETISTLKFADRAHSIMTQVSMNKLNSKGEGYNSKEFDKICDELFQLKQLLNIRRKRGTLEPIQEEFFKLKDENTLLKKNLGGENNIMRIKELVKENNNLRREIKTLSEQNKSLKKEMKGRSVININEDSYNISNINKNNYSGKKSPNNRYITNDNYNENNKSNNKISRNKNSNNGIDYSGNKKYLNTVNDMINSKEINNQNSFNKSKNKSTKKSKNNILRDSGQNIVYGMNNKNNNKLKNEDNLKKDLNKNNNDSNYDLNDSNLDINNNKNANSKMSKINNITSSYERLEKLDQLEEENKKETQELLDNMENNLNSQEEDI
jgi:hypothetical protein